ncbi:hypothetical protein, partial [Yoonia sp.]|uniref:hypothetical protein n=1 Tax=Yoonia sp. TaxID=2212373 RepID=UPI002DFC3050|nr:hypothetical protein [Yoonia sp.]
AAMGLHAQPEPMDDPLGNWLTAIVGKTAFPWITGGLVGVALGAWLHHAMSFLDRKRQGKDQLFGQLHSDLETAEKGWLDSLRDEEGEYDFSKKHHLKKLELEALYRELRLLGITTPVYEDLPPIEFNVGHYSYLQEMRVLSYRNQLQDAKNRSKEIEREFRAVIEQQQEQQIEA